MTTERRSALMAVALTCLMVLSVVGAGPVSADSQVGGDAETDTETTGYHLVQGGTCYDISPLQSGEDVEAFYDWEPNSEKNYSSQGTRDLQKAETSLLFLYEDGDGTLSLVMVHEKVGPDGGDGGAVTFDFDRMPTEGTWAVQDDKYDGASNIDIWNVNGQTQTVHWTWTGGRTDGGAYESLGEEFDIQITPKFNEDAEFYEEYYDGDVDEWELLSGDRNNPERTALDMNDPVRLRTGSCDASDGGDSDDTDETDNGNDGTDEKTDGNDDSDSDDSDDSEPAPTPDFEVVDASINQTNVTVGEPIEVTATVTNEGTAGGEFIGQFLTNMDLVETQYVDLDVGETQQLTFTRSFDSIGTYSVRVRNDHVGRVEVNPRPDPAADARMTDNGTAVVTVAHARAGSTVTTALPPRNDSAASVERLDVTTASATDRMTIEVASLDSSAVDTQPETGYEILGVHELGHNDSTAFANATIAFTVQPDDVADTTDAPNVTLLRYDEANDTWTQIETERIEEADDDH